MVVYAVSCYISKKYTLKPPSAKQNIFEKNLHEQVFLYRTFEVRILKVFLLHGWGYHNMYKSLIIFVWKLYQKTIYSIIGVEW